MRIIVTAGPTREFLDPVRFLSNRSSGKMGYALARTALGRGHKVTLISGPCSLAAPAGARVKRINSAAEMLDAVKSALPRNDALIMAAAVCDWRPAKCAERKIKKSRRHGLTLRLEPTPDILRSVASRKGRRIFIGFAAETDNLERNALRKLKEKRLDMIVANDVTRPDSGFEAETNRAILLEAGGGREALPLMSKKALALRIIKWLEQKAAKSEKSHEL